MTALNLIYDFVNGNKSENDAEPIDKRKKLKKNLSKNQLKDI
jgi:hypothetical protein